jgi:hypothetical protein
MRIMVKAFIAFCIVAFAIGLIANGAAFVSNYPFVTIILVLLIVCSIIYLVRRKQARNRV